MISKIIGYEAPIDLFNGAIVKGTIYKPLASTNNTTYAAVCSKGHCIDGGKTNLPREIVEGWNLVTENKFEIGDIVVSLTNCGNTRSTGDLFRVLGYNSYSEHDDGIFYMPNVWGYVSHFRIATKDEEYNYQLIEEARKRYPIGTMFIGAHIEPQTNQYSVITNTRFKVLKRSGGLSVYALTNNGNYYSSLNEYGNTTNDRVVWIEGKWAPIVDCPLVIINGYTGIFHKDHIEFGCVKISKQLFLELYAVKNSGWTNGREIELVTIGKGTFNKDHIKTIAEYYLSKSYD